MPTPKKTLAELKLSGTFQQNKRRYEHLTNPVATIQLPIGRPPAHLQAAEKAVWAELVRVAHSGLLSRSDRLILEIAAKLIIRMRTSDAKTSEFNALLSVLAKMGMTPAARLKMNLQPLELPASPTKSEQDKTWDALDELDD
jgi:phage terminase small subunit